ncbi:hypothetical protein LXL04_033005 [Taraxacum kok-saghyz]
MEDQTSYLLDFPYFYHGKVMFRNSNSSMLVPISSTEELTESLLITTMELEAERFKAEEELRLKDDQLIELKQLLNTAINERNEAQDKYQTLLRQNYPHYHQTHRQTTTPPPHSVVSSIEDEPITNGAFSSSDCEESIVSSPVTEIPVRLTPPPRSLEQELNFPVKALPEKGKFLEAVIKAGPLLQNLLLAGPLPHWRHPPPPLDTYQIPPPPIVLRFPPPINHLDGKFDRKRGFAEGSDSSTETKYKRIALS